MQRDVALGGLDRVDLGAGPHVLDLQHGDTALFENRCGDVERRTEDDGLRLDHPHDGLGVGSPHGEIGARCRLMQHGDGPTPHPRGLTGRGDIDGLAGEDPDGVAASDPGVGERSGHGPGDAMNLPPGLAQRLVGLPGDEAAFTAFGRGEHFLGELAQSRLLVERTSSALHLKTPWCTTLPSSYSILHRMGTVTRRTRRVPWHEQQCP